mmetsp:Transcript_8436/g.24144  ORF Transcript_8436/g.24144 Transcript_8436/m.24144 type:complete len:289 (+) Transcript_8436:116-982(+)
MFTVGELTDELNACERQIVAIRLKAEEKKQAELERLAQVIAKRDECIKAHRSRLDELVEECEQQLASVTSTTEEELAQLAEAKAKADERNRIATARACELDIRTRQLEQQVRRLCTSLDEQQAEQDEKIHDVRALADNTVQRVLEDCSSKVQAAKLHALELQGAALGSIEEMQQHARVRIEDAHGQSKQRSRFQHLVQQISLHKTQDLTAEQLVQAKTELLQAWMDEFVQHASAPTPETPSCLTTISPLAPSPPIEWLRRPGETRGSLAASGTLQVASADLRPNTAPS